MHVRSLRAQLALVIALASAIPVALTAGVLTWRATAQRQAQRSGRVSQAAAVLCRATEVYVGAHVAGVAAFAEGLSEGALSGGALSTRARSGPALDARLARLHATYDGFLTVLAARADGAVVSAHPRRRLDGAGPLVLPNVADRGYFQQAMATGRPFVSPAFRGRGFGAHPIVAVAAPVLDARGRPAGVVEGSFDLRRLGQFGDAFASAEAPVFLVLDAEDRVIFASVRDGPPPLTPFGGDPLVRRLTRAARGATPRTVVTAGVVEDGEEVSGAACRTAHGWRVVTRRPLAALRRDRRELLVLGAAVTLVAAAVAVGIAFVIARRVARPLTALAETLDATDGATRAPSASGVVERVQPGAAHEIVALAEHLDDRYRRAEAAEGALRDALARREGEVAARTRDLADVNRALAEREEELRLTQDAAGLRGWTLDFATDRLHLAPGTRHVVGLDVPEATASGSVEGAAARARIHPDDVAGADADLAEALAHADGRYESTYRAPGPDGTMRWVRATGAVERGPGGAPLRLRGVSMDVTSEVETRRRAEASEAELRALFAAMRDVVLVLDAEGTYVRVVDTAPDLLYRPAVDMQGRRMHDVLPPAAADRFVAVVGRVLATGVPESLEYALDREVGRTWYAAVVSAIGDGTVLWVARDVTAQKRAEAELALLHRVTHVVGAAEDADAALLAALEGLCEAAGWSYGEVWLPSADGTLLGHGPVWCAPEAPLVAFARASRSYQFRRGEGLPGRVWSSGAPVWVPDVTADDNFSRRALAAAAGFRASVGVPVLAEGEVVAVLAFHATAAHPEDAGRIALLATVASQIGVVVRRKRAEDALRVSEAFSRGVIEASPDCVQTLDLEGRLRTMNGPGRSAMEIDDFATLEGANWAALWPESGAAHVDAAVAEARAGREARFRGFCPTTTGAPKHWDVVVAPIVGPDGRPEQLLASSRDITAAVGAERLKEQLIALVSHEIRTPLGALRGALQLLAPGLAALGADAGSQEGRLLDMARRNADRLLCLVNDLLDLERLEAGATPLECHAVAATTLLGAARELAQPLAQQAGITLAVEVDAGSAWSDGRADGDRGPAQPLVVRADVDRVGQVLTNLVGNALKFTPAGGRVTLSAELLPPADQAPACVRFAVRDTGRGIPADQLGRVFERFAQVEVGDAKAKGGTGLGLAIAQAIVRQHGGQIWAESGGPGKGSTFAFTLAAADVTAVVAEPVGVGVLV